MVSPNDRDIQRNVDSAVVLHFASEGTLQMRTSGNVFFDGRCLRFNVSSLMALSAEYPIDFATLAAIEYFGGTETTETCRRKANFTSQSSRVTRRKKRRAGQYRLSKRMTFKLGCPNCGQQIEVTASAENSLIACTDCDRSYRVPALQRAETPARTERKSAAQRNLRFNIVVSIVATLTVALSIGGMLWLRTSNPIHGDSSITNESLAGTESEKIRWNENDLVADFAPIEPENLAQFVGQFKVNGTLDQQQALVFSAPESSKTLPLNLHITQHRFGTETLNLRFTDRAGINNWSDRILPTSARMGHGFRPVANFRPALSIVGTYSVDDFTDRGVACSVTTHRYINRTMVVTHYCLSEAEFAREVPLRDRNHLCKVVSTYALNAAGDTLTITKHATGADQDLTRRFVAMLHSQTIHARDLDVRGLEEFEDAWLTGKTITLQRM